MAKNDAFWTPPGVSADGMRHSFDLGTGQILGPGQMPSGGMQYNAPSGYRPAQDRTPMELVASPPGVAADKRFANFTPDIGVMTPPGAQAPVDRLNLTYVPKPEAVRPQSVPTPQPRPEDVAMQMLAGLGAVGGGQDATSSLGVGTGETIAPPPGGNPGQKWFQDLFNNFTGRKPDAVAAPSAASLASSTSTYDPGDNQSMQDYMRGLSTADLLSQIASGSGMSQNYRPEVMKRLAAPNGMQGLDQSMLDAFVQGTSLQEMAPAMANPQSPLAIMLANEINRRAGTGDQTAKTWFNMPGGINEMFFKGLNTSNKTPEELAEIVARTGQYNAAADRERAQMAGDSAQADLYGAEAEYYRNKGTSEKMQGAKQWTDPKTHHVYQIYQDGTYKDTGLIETPEDKYQIDNDGNLWKIAEGQQPTMIPSTVGRWTNMSGADGGIYAFNPVLYQNSGGKSGLVTINKPTPKAYEVGGMLITPEGSGVTQGDVTNARNQLMGGWDKFNSRHGFGGDVGTGEDGTTTMQSILEIARKYGLDPAVVRAILVTEGGYNGAVGDNGQSFGPFQFYTGGQLPAFQKAKNLPDLASAGQYAKASPLDAADWALKPGGYLGDAIRQGVTQGLSGADLATFAQKTGQRSVSPERAGANYQHLMNSAVPAPSPLPASKGGPKVMGRPIVDDSAPTVGDQMNQNLASQGAPQYGLDPNIMGAAKRWNDQFGGNTNDALLDLKKPESQNYLESALGMARAGEVEGWKPQGVGHGADMPNWTPPVNRENVVGTGNRFGQEVSMEGTHKGFDLQAYEGTPTVSPVDGRVVAINWKPEGLGLQVVIQDEKTGELHELNHLKEDGVIVRPGQQVSAGEPVAEVGSSGAGSTGPHLDYRIQSPEGEYENPEERMPDIASMPMSPDTVGEDGERLGGGQDFPSWDVGSGGAIDGMMENEPGTNKGRAKRSGGKTDANNPWDTNGGERVPKKVAGAMRRALGLAPDATPDQVKAALRAYGTDGGPSLIQQMIANTQKVGSQYSIPYDPQGDRALQSLLTQQRAALDSGNWVNYFKAEALIKNRLQALREIFPDLQNGSATRRPMTELEKIQAGLADDWGKRASGDTRTVLGSEGPEPWDEATQGRRFNPNASGDARTVFGPSEPEADADWSASRRAADEADIARGTRRAGGFGTISGDSLDSMNPQPSGWGRPVLEGDRAQFPNLVGQIDRKPNTIFSDRHFSPESANTVEGGGVRSWTPPREWVENIMPADGPEMQDTGGTGLPGQQQGTQYARASTLRETPADRAAREAPWTPGPGTTVDDQAKVQDYIDEQRWRQEHPRESRDQYQARQDAMLRDRENSLRPAPKISGAPDYTPRIERTAADMAPSYPELGHMFDNRGDLMSAGHGPWEALGKFGGRFGGPTLGAALGFKDARSDAGGDPSLWDRAGGAALMGAEGMAADKILQGIGAIGESGNRFVKMLPGLQGAAQGISRVAGPLGTAGNMLMAKEAGNWAGDRAADLLGLPSEETMTPEQRTQWDATDPFGALGRMLFGTGQSVGRGGSVGYGLDYPAGTQWDTTDGYKSYENDPSQIDWSQQGPIDTEAQYGVDPSFYPQDVREQLYEHNTGTTISHSGGDDGSGGLSADAANAAAAEQAKLDMAWKIQQDQSAASRYGIDNQYKIAMAQLEQQKSQYGSDLEFRKAQQQLDESYRRDVLTWEQNQLQMQQNFQAQQAELDRALHREDTAYDWQKTQGGWNQDWNMAREASRENMASNYSWLNWSQGMNPSAGTPTDYRQSFGSAFNGPATNPIMGQQYPQQYPQQMQALGTPQQGQQMGWAVEGYQQPSQMQAAPNQGTGTAFGGMMQAPGTTQPASAASGAQSNMPSWDQWQQMNPWQKTNYAVDQARQGVSQGQLSGQAQQQWGQQGGGMYGTTGLQMATDNQLGQMNRSIDASMWGYNPQDYYNQQQRQAKAGTTSGASQGWGGQGFSL